MFKSISMATPNSTVTAQFTANEACQVGVPTNSTVRVNNAVTTDNPVSLAVGDKIELDATSGPGNASVFVPWTYNGNTCYFGIASAATSNRPTLKSTSRGKTWDDIGGTTLFSYKTATTETTLGLNGTTSGNQTTELVPVMSPESRGLFFYREDGRQIYEQRFPTKPLAHTYMWDGATGTFVNYTLCADGFIYINSATKSTTAITGAKTIWSDGANLFVGGTNKMVRLSDYNTIAQTYVTTDTIIYGAAMAGTSMAVSASGKIFKLESNSTLTEVYSAAAVGEPTVFQNQFVFPICEEFKLRVFNNDGTFSKDVTTGDILPWSAGANAKNDVMVVSGVDTPNVLVYTDLNVNPTTKTFNYRVCYAMPIGGNIIASHYLRATNLAVPPNPPVSGINFPLWKAPINVDTGSGEANVVTEAEILAVASAPNAQLLVNGVTSNTYLSNQRVQMILRSAEGRRTTAMAIGNFAFDFEVRAEETEAFATDINVTNQFLASQVVFTFTIPERTISAPIAVSHGTMQLNNAPYNGTTPVSAGDTIKVTINVPTTATKYWSMVSIADAQFALTVASAVTRIADLQRFQDYSSLVTVSTIKVDEDGTYYFPNYTDAKVFKDDVELTFPVDLLKDDELVVHHIMTSSWWLDPRNTIILGPTINYVCQSTTTVDDAPDYIDFGKVHMGIPDFKFPGDLLGTISGLSDGFKVQIYNEYMSFVVNGGAPEERPFVKNGDVVQAIYRVKNLFETMWAKVDLLAGGTYEFGELNIDPALGEWMPARPSLDKGGVYQWARFRDELKDPQASVALKQTLGIKPSPVVRGLRVQSKIVGATQSTGKWVIGSALPGKKLSGQWIPVFQLFPPQPITPKVPTPPAYRTTALSKGITAAPPVVKAATSAPQKAVAPTRFFNKMTATSPYLNTYTFASMTYFLEDEPSSIRLVGQVVEHEASFGYPATYTNFSPTFHHEASVSPRSVMPFYVYQELVSVRSRTPTWERLESRDIRFQDVEWAYTSENLPRWEEIQPKFTTENVIRSKTIMSTWFSGVIIRTKVFQAQFIRETKIVSKTIQPVFVPSARTISKAIQPRFTNQSMATKSMIADKAKPTSYSGKQTGGVVHGRHNWSYTNPIRAGGLPTAQAAQAEATTYNNVLPVTVYQQPEGTFSYVFARDTGLVCDIKGTNMYATKWLIGGG